VTIEEPHMYNEDDAVAKIDGYIVSVTGAGRLIGEQRLVRVERVGRASADASLVEGANGAPTGERDEDRPARRRRRGGRGRSHADAVAEGAD
jgi:ribonuclease G